MRRVVKGRPYNSALRLQSDKTQQRATTIAPYGLIGQKDVYLTPQGQRENHDASFLLQREGPKGRMNWSGGASQGGVCTGRIEHVELPADHVRVQGAAI